MGFKMSARKKIALLICLLPYIAVTSAAHEPPPIEILTPTASMTQVAIANALGWVVSNDNNCCGYFMDEPFIYPTIHKEPNNTVQLSSRYGVVSRRGTSILEQDVTIIRYRQQLTGRKAYIYRDPTTAEITSVEILDNVHFREPNTFMIGDRGTYDFDNEKKKIEGVFYRTTLKDKQVLGPLIPDVLLGRPRKITGTTAWGEAAEFRQDAEKIYDFYDATFSSCAPINPTWQIKAKYLRLNKISGRGYATHVRLLWKNTPIFYLPYLNFSIDNQRKTGFLWPKIGGSTKWGTYTLIPFYWNMAPNYDMLINAGLLSKRGLFLTDYFRYLTETTVGKLNIGINPYDRFFAEYKEDLKKREPDQAKPPDVIAAELDRLYKSSNTRAGISWRNDTRFNKNWSSHIDLNYVTDDYYYTDYGNDLNEVSLNTLLQIVDLYYKNEHWDFTARLQAYQTLHPVEEPLVLNTYRRLPQLILNADYPNQFLGLEFFVRSEATNFSIVETPGFNLYQPAGRRYHVQPGVSLPLYWPYFFINPRFQLALTAYQLTYPDDMPFENRKGRPSRISRAVPIFDVVSGLALNRDCNFWGYSFLQTLEPQIYYVYIPYRNQQDIPIFDTTVNTLLYDSIFIYNRFTSIDRIGDANQVGFGVTTRFIDQETGLEKIRLGVGEIVYFADRRVTLCNGPTCQDNPKNPSDSYRLSPITGVLNFAVTPNWALTANALWNPITAQLDNTTIGFSYRKDNNNLFNVGYTYARGGDILSGIQTTDPSNNLKVTTVSFAYELLPGMTLLGLWSQNWNHQHLQNVLYGLQYETCCWAIRAMGGKAFTGIDTRDNSFQYTQQYFVEISLKAVGNIGTGSNPEKLLANIRGYNPLFGQDL